MSFFHEYHGEPRIIHNQKIRFEPHLHYEVEIIALFRGRVSLTVGGKDYSMCGGDLLIVFPNTVHSYTLEEGVDVGKFIFSPDTLPELRDVFGSSFPRSPIISDCPELTELAADILDSFEKSSAAVKKAYLLLLAGKMIEKCAPESKSDFDGDTLNAILDYCRNNFRNGLRQRDVACALHVSESYISHVFSAKMEINFCKYLNILRVNEARRLLTEGSESITEIAYECGFSSPRSFNRAFAELTGTSPREYRKSFAVG